MSALPIAEWQHSLAEMDAALAATLAALDRYHAAWHEELADLAPAGGGWGVSFDGLDARLREWDGRLAAAGELAAAVGRELDDREAAVGRWREVIQQGVGSGAAAAAG